MVEKKKKENWLAASGLELQAPLKQLKFNDGRDKAVVLWFRACAQPQDHQRLYMRNEGQNSLEIGCGSYCLQ